MKSSTSQWFDIDREGLAKLRADAPKSALVFELVQNVWDTAATFCKVDLTPAGAGIYRLTVEDDNPEGFSNLAHAYTLFAESEKKADATKRGRFNLGEKLVLAMCHRATIASTKGKVTFGQSGRIHSEDKREAGSRFLGEIDMTQAEADEIRQAIHRLIPPTHCATTFNGEPIEVREPVARTDWHLPSVLADGSGVLRRTRRKTTVDLYEPREGEVATIYEMGIPVVESGDRYHYDIAQKVPLTIDRAGVTPEFLREVRCAAAEAASHLIDADAANEDWVRTGASSPNASPTLVKAAFEARFGKDAVIYDMSDREANGRAVLAGQAVVHGSQLSKAEWANVKAHAVALPAGKVHTSHRLDTAGADRPFTQTTKTRGMELVGAFAEGLAEYAGLGRITTEFVSEPTMGFAACYGSKRLTFNVGRLGKRAFEAGLTQSLLDTIIHELAHDRAENHLSPEFYNECTRIGAAAAWRALEYPEFYRAARLEGVAV